MTKLSAIIIAGNRENVIEGCLKSLDFVDEKIVVNNNITDNTVKIASQYDCRIIKAKKKYDFSQWRNQGALAATGEWLLYVDTDERVMSELKEEISKVIKQSAMNSYQISRKNYFWGKEFKTEWPDYQLRLFRKKDLISWRGNIHEIPDVKGEIGKLKHPLVHLSHRNIKESLENTLKWSWLEAENRFNANHPKMTGWRFLRIIITGFWQQFIKRKIWREGVEGVIEGIYQTFSLFITYVRLWQLQNKKSLIEKYQEIEKQV